MHMVEIALMYDVSKDLVSYNYDASRIRFVSAALSVCHENV